MTIKIERKGIFFKRYIFQWRKENTHLISHLLSIKWDIKWVSKRYSFVEYLSCTWLFYMHYLCTLHDSPESCQVGKITPSLHIKQKRQHLEIHSVPINSQDMNVLLSNSKNYDLPISTLALLRDKKKILNLLSKLISSSKK